VSIDFHRLVRLIDINLLIFIDYYRLYRLISDDRLSSIGHAGLYCKLVEHKDIHPILGRKACIDMNILQYTNNDAVNKPTTRNAAVYSVADNPNGIGRLRL